MASFGCRHHDLRRQIVLLCSWYLVLIWHNTVAESNDMCKASRDQSSQISCNCSTSPEFVLQPPPSPAETTTGEFTTDAVTYIVTEQVTTDMTSSSPSTVTMTTTTIGRTSQAPRSSQGSTPSKEKTTVIHTTHVVTQEGALTTQFTSSSQPTNTIPTIIVGGKDDKSIWTAALIAGVVGGLGCLLVILIVLCVVYIRKKKRFDRLKETDSSTNSTPREPDGHRDWHSPQIIAGQAQPGLTPKTMNADAAGDSDKQLKSLGAMPDYEEDIFSRRSSMPNPVHTVPRADYDDDQGEKSVFYRDARAHQHTVQHLAFNNPIYNPSSYAAHPTTDPRQNNARSPPSRLAGPRSEHSPDHWKQRYSERSTQPRYGARDGEAPNKYEEQYGRLQNVYGHNFTNVNKGLHFTH